MKIKQETPSTVQRQAMGRSSSDAGAHKMYVTGSYACSSWIGGDDMYVYDKSGMTTSTNMHEARHHRAEIRFSHSSG